MWAKTFQIMEFLHSHGGGKIHQFELEMWHYLTHKLAYLECIGACFILQVASSYGCVIAPAELFTFWPIQGKCPRAK